MGYGIIYNLFSNRYIGKYLLQRSPGTYFASSYFIYYIWTLEEYLDPGLFKKHNQRIYNNIGTTFLLLFYILIYKVVKD